MNLTIEPRESHVLARIEDTRLDALSAPDFKARMSGALAGSAPKVVLDLSPVAFIDSAGLASILSLVKGLPEGGERRTPVQAAWSASGAGAGGPAEGTAARTAARRSAAGMAERYQRTVIRRSARTSPPSLTPPPRVAS